MERMDVIQVLGKQNRMLPILITPEGYEIARRHQKPVQNI